MDTKPLSFAIHKDNIWAAIYLVQHGAPVDADALEIAFKRLLAIPEHYNSSDPEYAKERKFFFFLLSQPGAPANHSYDGKSLLYRALDARLSDDVIQTLKARGATLLAQNTEIAAFETGDVLGYLEGILDGPNTPQNDNNNTTIPNNAFPVAALASIRKYVDMDWLYEQMNYITALTPEQHLVLNAYTRHGDQILNSYLRDVFDMKKFTEFLEEESLVSPFYRYLLKQAGQTPETASRTEFVGIAVKNYAAYMDAYKEDLWRIIYLSPRPTRAIKIFRGLKRPQFMMAELRKSKTVETSDFQSTSLLASSAFTFSGEQMPNGHTEHKGAVVEILLRRDTPCLFMESLTQYPQEFEVLLPPHITFVHRGTTMKKTGVEWMPADFEYPVIELEALA